MRLVICTSPAANADKVRNCLLRNGSDNMEDSEDVSLFPEEEMLENIESI
jgi:hypothetical protein